ncbi:hypothetical protein ACLI4U_01565 [Natrialbaceae archaeon A-CW2]
MQRRNLLKAVGSGATIIGVTGVSSAADSDTGYGYIVDEVIQLRGSKRRKLISEIRSDSEVRKLLREVRKDGWSTNWRSTSTHRSIVDSDDDSGSFDVGLVTLTHKEKQGEMALLWKGNVTVESVEEEIFIGHILEDTSIAQSDENKKKSTIYTVGNNGVNKQTGTVGSESKDDTNNVSVSSGPGCPVDVLVSEGNWDLWCTIRVAANAGATILSCVGIIITPKAVAACLLSAGLTADQVNQCMGSTTHKTKNIEQEWLREFADYDPVTSDPSLAPCTRYSVANDAKIPMDQETLDDAPSSDY